jgi:hypothetical protein
MSDEHWQLEGGAAELYQRYLVPPITTKWAEDLVDRAQPALWRRPCALGELGRGARDNCPGGKCVDMARYVRCKFSLRLALQEGKGTASARQRSSQTRRRKGHDG